MATHFHLADFLYSPLKGLYYRFTTLTLLLNYEEETLE